MTKTLIKNGIEGIYPQVIKEIYYKPTPTIIVVVSLLVSDWVKSLSCVRLFATPWTVAYQAAQSMEFPRQIFYDPMDCSLPDNSVHGIS